jgi:hypothetical protein
MTVDRAGFKQTFRNGIDMGDANVRARLDAATLTKLDALAGADRIIPQSQLDAAFKVVDDFDRNGSAHSFNENDPAVKVVFDALLLGRVATGADGRAVRDAALALIRADGAGYAYDAYPKATEHPKLRGNVPNGTDRLGWLANNNKCNVFVCETLTRAGFEVPLVMHPGNVAHYDLAEKLPGSPQHFDRLRSLSDVQVGDVIVNDYPGRGGSTAHTEVITAIDRDGNGDIVKLETAGAHYDGAYTKDWTSLLRGLSHQRNGRFDTQPDDGRPEHAQGGVYFLRPKLRRSGSPTNIRSTNTPRD